MVAYLFLISWDFSALMSKGLCGVWNTQVWLNALPGRDLTARGGNVCECVCVWRGDNWICVSACAGKGRQEGGQTGGVNVRRTKGESWGCSDAEVFLQVLGTRVEKNPPGVQIIRTFGREKDIQVLTEYLLVLNSCGLSAQMLQEGCKVPLSAVLRWPFWPSSFDVCVGVCVCTPAVTLHRSEHIPLHTDTLSTLVYPCCVLFRGSPPTPMPTHLLDSMDIFILKLQNKMRNPTLWKRTDSRFETLTSKIKREAFNSLMCFDTQ